MNAVNFHVLILIKNYAGGILRTAKKKTSKAKWIGHTLRMNRLLKHVIEHNVEERTEMKGRLGRRRKQLLSAYN
jgi:hypothetical protein